MRKKSRRKVLSHVGLSIDHFPLIQNVESVDSSNSYPNLHLYVINVPCETSFPDTYFDPLTPCTLIKPFSGASGTMQGLCEKSYDRKRK